MVATELEKLEAQIKELQDKRKALLDEERNAKLGEIKAIIKQFGFTAAEIGLSSAKKPIRPKAEARYIHPQNPQLTWAGGKGRKPAWVNAFLAGGGNLADIQVKK